MKGYKRHILLGCIIGLVFGTIVVIAGNTTKHITYPEKGITCVSAETIWGSIAPAGCYRGDINKDGNCLDIKATEEYQNGNRVTYTEKDKCIPH